MFKKHETNVEEAKMGDYEKASVEDVSEQKTNTILKGSKLTGDINISYDLELSGEVEGNITSEHNSNIVIKGNCKGNIKTKGGNVNIEGEMNNGDIIAGGDVKIMGKFNGGKIEAKGKIYANGELNGKLKSNEIEIGPTAQVEGELLYKEYVSISRGAKVEAHISQVQEEQRERKKSTETKVVNLERTAQEMSEA